ncbi:MAG: hypothetical protein LBC02_04600 [Planctomycetaceae bacterium]|jgi:beta-galactosidase/beta-glucuronidase|nr:hypothetical protein [Planctomycetaceae bacterium]
MYKNNLCKVVVLSLTTVFFFLTATDYAVIGNTVTRDSISLDGTWKFATDPNQVGEKEEWFKPGYPFPKMPLEGYAPTANGTIQVPGSWDAQGYGTENERIKHCYTGKGWYKKMVSIPATWKDHKIFLQITGIARYAKIWINGLPVESEMIGCLGPHERDVTTLISPGQNSEITLCVDSKQRYEIDALFGAGQLADYICNKYVSGVWCGDTWGGIWGHVLLEAHPQTRLEDLFIRTKIDGTCRAQFLVLHDTANLNADTLKLEIFETKGKLVTSKTVPFKITNSGKPNDIETIEVNIPEPKLWSPESTNLYIAKVTLLQDNKPLDEIQTRFGIREFTINGSDFLLNGKKLMLCGYGDDHIYPQEWNFSSDKEMYLKRLRLIRSFGFNFVRHHSTIMPPEYYEACDETGMIPMAEFPIVYQPFMPGEQYWLTKVPTGTSTEPAFQVYRDRWEAAIKQLRNHPCIIAWVMGNEIGGTLPQFAQLRLDFQRIAKTNDPDRFFCDTDGGDWKGYFDDPKNNRNTLDFVSYQFNEWGSSPIFDKDKFILPKQQKPTLVHETGNYITFPRLDEIELYETSNFKPFWMTDGKTKLEQLGLLKEAHDWAVASEK